MKVYGLKNCDRCRKAIDQLLAAGHEVKFFDIRITPLDRLQIAFLLKEHGEKVLVNRKSTTWRNLDNDVRNLPCQDLLERHPTLVKRPIIFSGKGSYVGWGIDEQTACGVL